MPGEVHSVQQKLCERYETFRRDADIPSKFAEKLSCPLLLSVSEPWLTSRFRVLVVGQETFGWSFLPGEYYSWPYPPLSTFEDFKEFPAAIEALVHGYMAFEYSKHQPRSAAGCFWTAYRKLRAELEEGIEGSVAWTNLFRTDFENTSPYRKARPEEINLLLKSQAGLLLDEIGILEPKVVIFLTGPRYDEALRFQFPDLTFNKLGSRTPTQLAVLQHPTLPRLSFRTYHPTYLRRAKLWGILTEVIEEIKAHWP